MGPELDTLILKRERAPEGVHSPGYRPHMGPECHGDTNWRKLVCLGPLSGRPWRNCLDWGWDPINWP